MVSCFKRHFLIVCSADTYRVKKPKRGGKREILNKKVSEKKKMIKPMTVANEHGEFTETLDVPVAMQKKQALTDEQILKLAQIGEQIEEYYKTAQDIEWAIEKKEIYILQSRSITTLYPLPRLIEKNLSQSVQEMQDKKVEHLQQSKYRIYISFGHLFVYC